jgi:DNA-binding protein H-NS
MAASISLNPEQFAAAERIAEIVDRWNITADELQCAAAPRKLSREQSSALARCRTLIDFWQITLLELDFDAECPFNGHASTSPMNGDASLAGIGPGQPIMMAGAAKPGAGGAPGKQPKYVHPKTGETWDGDGLHPDWLRKALLQEGYYLRELTPRGTADHHPEQSTSV